MSASNLVRAFSHQLKLSSLLASSRQRNEVDLRNKLIALVPDITNQYSTFSIPKSDALLNLKVRCLHAAQISLVMKAIKRISGDSVNIVDIGDSSGTHLQYLRGLSKSTGKQINSVSVNMDSAAVERIRSKGLVAYHARAEELHTLPDALKADVFTLFETLEHFFNPIAFLKTMADKAECEYLVVTVPYIKRSRVGLGYIRHGWKGDFQSENTHIFELCPRDWDLLYKFSGWEIVESDCFSQYPQKGLLNLTKFIWRRSDFDGFYGVILKKNSSYSDQYKDW